VTQEEGRGKETKILDLKQHGFLTLSAVVFELADRIFSISTETVQRVRNTVLLNFVRKTSFAFDFS
jgi:PIN domain nuclease of toxin-antitoxin system